MLFCLVGYSSLVDEGEPIKEIGCFSGWSSVEDAVGNGDSKWDFEGVVAEKTSKSGGNGVAKKTIDSRGNGVCWVKVDDCGRFCFNQEGRHIWEHCLLFLWRW